MSRTAWTAALAGVVAGLAVVAWLLARDSTAPAPAAPPPPRASTVPLPPTPLPVEGAVAGVGSGLRTTEVMLYFAHPEGQGLVAEPREIFDTAAILDRMKQTVGALLRGPAADSPLLPTLPGNAPLLDFFLDADGTAYVDFGRELTRQIRPGVTSELLAAGSLAHTLSANFPGVRRVRVLVMGEEINTLGGHLDLTRPLFPDPSLIVPLAPEGEEGEDTATLEETINAASGRPQS